MNKAAYSLTYTFDKFTANVDEFTANVDDCAWERFFFNYMVPTQNWDV